MAKTLNGSFDAHPIFVLWHYKLLASFQYQVICIRSVRYNCRMTSQVLFIPFFSSGLLSLFLLFSQKQGLTQTHTAWHEISHDLTLKNYVLSVGLIGAQHGIAICSSYSIKWLFNTEAQSSHVRMLSTSFVCRCSWSLLLLSMIPNLWKLHLHKC